MKKKIPMGMSTLPFPYCIHLDRVVEDNWYCADFEEVEHD
jgi:hypothetical protein